MSFEPARRHHNFSTVRRYVPAVDDSAIPETQALEIGISRPTLVIFAAAMLATGGALFAGEVLLSTDRYFTGMRVYEQAAADDVIENEGAFGAVGVVLHVYPAALGVIIGCGLVFLAFFTAIGHNWARAVSWIMGVPVLFWYGALAILYLALWFLSDPVTANSMPPELTRRYEQAWPGWLDTLDNALMISVPLVLLTALVCQTVPAADTYFRFRRQQPGNAKLV